MDALLLDFDGTICEIAPTPATACLSDEMALALRSVRERLHGRVAIVSGRAIETLEQLIPVEGLMLVGVHGLEVRLRDGRVDRPPPAPGLEVARMRLAELVAREPGLLLEDKGLSVALHYREAPGLAPIAHAKARAMADSLGLQIQTGKMVVELRTPGADKGSAVALVMQEPDFKTYRPVFVGDDDTDEAAFGVAADLGGFGIRVGVRSPGSSALFGLGDVAAVRAWLEAGE
jgi:trehalose 6-phosphate phosphatase